MKALFPNNPRAQGASLPKVVRDKTVLSSDAVMPRANINYTSILLDAHDTGGAFTLSRTVLSPDADVPAPTRDYKEKLLFVQDGCVRVCIGVQTFELHAGEAILLPRGVPHSLSSTRCELATVLCWEFESSAEEKLLLEERDSTNDLSASPESQSASVAQFKIARADKGECFAAFGETMRVLVTSSEALKRYCAVEMETPPLRGLPMHMHQFHATAFLIYSGRYEFCLDDARVVVEAGDVVWAPCRVPHSYRVLSSDPGRMFMLSAPGGFDTFFAGCVALCGIAQTMSPEWESPEWERHCAKFGVSFLQSSR
ncbi:MAG TPA: cupin domain-containing protein [Abditibacteriaceae bacterium]